jgi:hypothetical protein
MRNHDGGWSREPRGGSLLLGEGPKKSWRMEDCTFISQHGVSMFKIIMSEWSQHPEDI